MFKQPVQVEHKIDSPLVKVDLNVNEEKLVLFGQRAAKGALLVYGIKKAIDVASVVLEHRLTK